jgi:hypothetical protein
MVLLDRSGTAGVEGLVLAFGQVGQAIGHGVFHEGEANAPECRPKSRPSASSLAPRSALVKAET